MNAIDIILRQKAIIKFLILLIVLTVVIGLYWQFLYRPVITEINTLEPQLNTLKAELSAKKEIVKEKPRYEAELEETRHKLIVALKQLPDKSEIPTLLENISALGKASGLKFLLFKPKAEIPKNFYAEIPVDITIQGKYKDMVLFYDRVSKMPRIVNMSDIVMGSPKKDAGGNMVITTSCNATTYKFIEEGESTQ
ncbi:MAG: type 4a pilus biogenesis protein PilO [Deltaproteobacteria bacterium]|nr:type 4a pilus biogenesis protein PilO [Deltaproteobacteria bacterium]